MAAGVILVVACILAYLFGSVSFAVIISEKFIKKDVRDLGSGNAGMTNVMRSAGVGPGVLTFVCDCLKGVAAGLLGKYLVFPWLFRLTENSFFSDVNGALFLGVFCLIGHVFPIFFGFRGGKGVATVGGVAIAACPLSFAAALAVFAVVVLITRMVSAGSLAAAVALPFFAYLFEKNHYRFASLVVMAVMCIAVMIKHKDNIVRIIKGEERKINFKKKK